MNNIQKFNELISDSCDFISDPKLYSEIVEALEVLEIIEKYNYGDNGKTLFIAVDCMTDEEQKKLKNYLERKE